MHMLLHAEPDEPTVEEIVDAVARDEAFRAAIGGSERAQPIAEAAVKAALLYIGLFALVEEMRDEVAGHG